MSDPIPEKPPEKLPEKSPERLPGKPISLIDSQPAFRPGTPGWFFGLALIFLGLRPFLDLSGISGVAAAPFHEQISLAILALIALFTQANKKSLIAFILWILANEYFSLLFPVPFAIRALLLFFFFELLSPELGPSAWCLFWLTIPSFHTEIFGEPLSPVFFTALIGLCALLAWRTTLPRWYVGQDTRYLSDLFCGLAIGTVIAVFPPIAVPLPVGAVPPVFFDETHGSGESAAGNVPLPNGHQQMRSLLEEFRVPVSVTTQTIDLVSTFSTIITILPTRPFSSTELDQRADYVARGGRMLIILDHTDMDGASSRLSPLLAKWGLRPGFDTIPQADAFFPTTGFSRMLGKTIGLSGTGGTLRPPGFWLPSAFQLQGPHPLVWVSGSTQASPGKQGPQWIAAWGCHGQGRWAVFADSSWFQNSHLTQNVGFLWKLLAVLHGPLEQRHPLQWLGIFAVLFFFFSLLYRRLGKPMLMLGMILGIGIGQTAYSYGRNLAPPLDRPNCRLICDSRGIGQVTGLRPGTFAENYDVLLNELFEGGLQTSCFFPQAQLPLKTDLWILPPLDAIPESAFVEQLEDQVQQGGNLILLGDPQLRGSQQVFERFGFQLVQDVKKWYLFNSTGAIVGATTVSVATLPAVADRGPFSLQPSSHPLLGSWTEPLWSDEPFPLTGGQSLFQRSDGETIVAARKVGKGQVIAIGDPLFFRNSALEVRGVLKDEIKLRFVRELCQTLFSKGKP